MVSVRSGRGRSAGRLRSASRMSSSGSTRWGIEGCTVNSLPMGIFDLFSGGRKPGLPDKIEVAPGIRLSTELAEYWPRIERTRMQSIGIKATPIDNPAPRKSSIGCYPILPRGFAYPQNAHGTPLYPLAQICCSELPLLGDYPDKGYLQLYIWLGDYGADFGNPTNQRNFRVLYF